MFKQFLKLFSIVSICAIALSGCAGLQTNDDVLTEIAVSNSARGLGYAVARVDNPQLEKTIEEAYKLVTIGQLDEVATTAIIQRFNTAGEKMIVYAALDLLKVMGAYVNVDQGSVIDLSGIPARLWDVAARSYRQGFDMGIENNALFRAQ